MHYTENLPPSSRNISINTISRKRDIISRKRDIISRKRDIISRNRDIISRNRDIISRKRDIISRKRDIISRKRDIISRKQDIISRKRDIISRKRDKNNSHLVLREPPYHSHSQTQIHIEVITRLLDRPQMYPSVPQCSPPYDQPIPFSYIFVIATLPTKYFSFYKLRRGPNLLLEWPFKLRSI